MEGQSHLQNLQRRCKDTRLRFSAIDYAKLRRRLLKTPAWLRAVRSAYHNYGGKHFVLILLLIAYAFFGAAVFYFIEHDAAEDKEHHWNVDIAHNRTIWLNNAFEAIFNESFHLIFLDDDTTVRVYNILQRKLIDYEKQLGIKYSDQKIKWDFWNAMLYAWTICTTIGYGHLYPSTDLGRLATMLYALVGIPLVLSILDDFGKLLTVALKYPWMLIKMFLRRAFRHCTRQSWREIKEQDDHDRIGLSVFDLPIPVAVALVIVWILICSATFCIWERRWNYFTAFYFFFISLSTIGLGDIVPDHPRYLLMLFIYIIIGLSLLSMCINLIQMKLKKSYDTGKEVAEIEHYFGDVMPNVGQSAIETVITTTATLGIFQTASHHSIKSMQYSATSADAYLPWPRVDEHLPQKQTEDKMIQTTLSAQSDSYDSQFSLCAPSNEAYFAKVNTRHEVDSNPISSQVESKAQQRNQLSGACARYQFGWNMGHADSEPLLPCSTPRRTINQTAHPSNTYTDDILLEPDETTSLLPR